MLQRATFFVYGGVVKANLKGLSSQNLESHFIIYYYEFEGADHESAI